MAVIEIGKWRIAIGGPPGMRTDNALLKQEIQAMEEERKEAAAADILPIETVSAGPTVFTAEEIELINASKPSVVFEGSPIAPPNWFVPINEAIREVNSLAPKVKENALVTLRKLINSDEAVSMLSLHIDNNEVDKFLDQAKIRTREPGSLNVSYLDPTGELRQYEWNGMREEAQFSSSVRSIVYHFSEVTTKISTETSERNFVPARIHGGIFPGIEEMANYIPLGSYEERTPEYLSHKFALQTALQVLHIIPFQSEEAIQDITRFGRSLQIDDLQQ